MCHVLECYINFVCDWCLNLLFSCQSCIYIGSVTDMGNDNKVICQLLLNLLSYDYLYCYEDVDMFTVWIEVLRLFSSFVCYCLFIDICLYFRHLSPLFIHLSRMWSDNCYFIFYYVCHFHSFVIIWLLTLSVLYFHNNSQIYI